MASMAYQPISSKPGGPYSVNGISLSSPNVDMMPPGMSYQSKSPWSISHQTLSLSLLRPTFDIKKAIFYMKGVCLLSSGRTWTWPAKFKTHHTAYVHQRVETQLGALASMNMNDAVLYSSAGRCIQLIVRPTSTCFASSRLIYKFTLISHKPHISVSSTYEKYHSIA